MKMVKVKSSNIHAVGHEGSMLRVQFKDKAGNPGAIWNYHMVPSHIHAEMMGAESIGSHFARHVKPHYKGTKHADD